MALVSIAINVYHNSESSPVSGMSLKREEETLQLPNTRYDGRRDSMNSSIAEVLKMLVP